MKKLEQKYRHDELSSEDLKMLRETLESMPDEEIEQTLRDGWMNEEPNVTCAGPARIERMKRRIDQQLGFIRPAQIFFIKATRAVAVVLFLLLAYTSFYFYHENKQWESEDIIVSTAKGERANITLPDGTQVTLNVESKLRYTPKRYNDVRQVGFEGEAFFQVRRDSKHPFRIDSKDLYVTVSGTSFNLLARKDGRTAELAMEEGNVRFVSLQTGEEVTLNPGQKAILDYSNGEITVLTGNDVQYASAWKRGDLVFRNTPLANVLEVLQENYGISFETDCKPCLTDLFTGTITHSDLNETLDILEKTYHFKAILYDGKVRLLQDRQP
ncbi:MAG: FecR domain-containing protein [Tannerella sp.]|jgi:ferric-dicitrate binding protein FerR (iron transport regulator)|nr:FecR domain-containing protein [Tannerella sp.]